jgi:hypothetical protein
LSGPQTQSSVLTAVASKVPKEGKLLRWKQKRNGQLTFASPTLNPHITPTQTHGNTKDSS